MRRLFALLFLATALWSGFWGLGMLLHKPDNSALLVGVILCGGALGALAIAASIAFPRKDAAHGGEGEVENPAQARREAIGFAALMVALALVIVFVTLRDLAMGMVKPLVSDVPYVHWRQTPVLFLLESALWLLLALLLGWVGPRWLLRKSPRAPERPVED